MAIAWATIIIVIISLASSYTRRLRIHHRALLQHHHHHYGFRTVGRSILMTDGDAAAVGGVGDYG